MRAPTPVRVVLALLVGPGPAFAQFKPVVGDVPVAPGTGGMGVGIQTPVGGQNYNLSGAGAPVSLAPSAAFTAAPRVTAVPAGGAMAASADPRTAMPAPAAAQAYAPGAQAPSYSPRAAANTASAAAPAERAPGALPTFDDPSRRTPDGGQDPKGAPSGLADDLAKAKKDEASGKTGAINSQLDSLFDFTKARSGTLADPAVGAAAADGAAGATAIGEAKGPGASVAKYTALARGAENAEAPAHYLRAAAVARESMPAAEAEAKVAALRAEAGRRAPNAVQGLAERAMDAASQGRTTDAIRYAKGVDGWDAMVGAPGAPYVENLSQFTATVKHVLAKALENPGRPAPAPKIRFEPSASARRGAAAAPVRARFKYERAEDGPVTAVPSGLAASLALPELAGFVPLEGPDAPAGPELSAKFSLRPEAGFASRWRSARAAKSSVWSSFWVAARGAVASAAASLWDELKAVFVRILQALGILRAAAPVGPVVVELDDAALARLRAAEPERVERPAAPASQPDALGLGYRLIGMR